MLQTFYNSTLKRIGMRFLEIFALAGVIGILESEEFVALIPAVFIGILAAILKALREYQSRTHIA